MFFLDEGLSSRTFSVLGMMQSWDRSRFDRKKRTDRSIILIDRSIELEIQNAILIDRSIEVFIFDRLIDRPSKSIKVLSEELA
jgi:ribosomal protein L31E